MFQAISKAFLIDDQLFKLVAYQKIIKYPSRDLSLSFGSSGHQETPSFSHAADPRVIQTTVAEDI